MLIYSLYLSELYITALLEGRWYNYVRKVYIYLLQEYIVWLYASTRGVLVCCKHPRKITLQVYIKTGPPSTELTARWTLEKI